MNFFKYIFKKKEDKSYTKLESLPQPNFNIPENSDEDNELLALLDSKLDKIEWTRYDEYYRAKDINSGLEVLVYRCEKRVCINSRNIKCDSSILYKTQEIYIQQQLRVQRDSLYRTRAALKNL